MRKVHDAVVVNYEFHFGTKQNSLNILLSEAGISQLGAALLTS